MSIQLLPHELDSAKIISAFDNTDIVRRYVPSLFSTTAHPRMSGRYGYTNTYALLQYLINRGFVLRSVQQTGRGEFGKLMIRMTHPELYRSKDGEAQVVIIDSHDGTSAFKVVLGWFRFVCANGLIMGDKVFERRLKHTQPDLVEQVILDLDDAMHTFPKVLDVITRMQALHLDGMQIANLARAIARVRFSFDEAEEARYDRAALALLPVRRSEDTAPDLYTAMNRMQENALRGGMQYTHNGQSHRVAPVSAINKQMDVNQGAWQAAVALLEAV